MKVINFKNKKLYILFIVIIIVVLVSIFSIYFLRNTNSKYVNSTKWNHYYDSESFYFFSRELDEFNSNEYINYYNYEDIDITINNGIGIFDATSYDISYELECNIEGSASDFFECSIDNGDFIKEYTLKSNYACYDNEIKLNYTKEECKENNKEWIPTLNTKTHKITLKKSANTYDGDSVRIKIVATSKKPYEKTISSLYILNLDNNINSIFVELLSDNYNICEYLVSNNYSSDKTIRLVSNNIFFLKNDDYNYTNNNDINFVLTQYETKKIILFKNNLSHNCDKNDLQISIIN